MKLKGIVLVVLSLFVQIIYANEGLKNMPTPKILKATLSGKIIDASTNLPLSGVSIYISDVKVGATSDEMGNYSILHVPQGKHIIEISHIGYNTIVDAIELTGDVRKDYTLSASVVENNAVVVTGVTSATQLKQVPFQVNVLRREELLQNASGNIIEALAKKPGVSSLSTGPAISKPIIRGLGYNRVLTINDGVRQEGQQWGDEHGIEIDEASIQKVEILKGPASLIYGSDAMAGVVNIITNVPLPNNTMKANIQTGYQTNNKGALLNANWGGNANGFNWNFYSSSLSAADYKNKYDGNVYNSKFNQNNLGGYAGYNGNWGYSHVLVSNFNLKAGLVEGERDDQGNFIKPLAGGGEAPADANDFNSKTPQIPYQHIRHFKIASDNSIRLGKSRLALNVGFQRNQREEFGNIDDLAERALYFDLKTITYTAQLHLKELAGWKTSIGINGMQQENTNRGVEQLIPDYDLFDIGGFVYTRKTIKKATFSGGVRYDNRNLTAKDLMEGIDVKGAGFKKSFSNFSGSIGTALALSSNLNVKLNVARAFRAPSIPELASNGAHEGTIRYEYGDVDLKSEISTQIDAGVEFSTDHISFGLSAYNNHFNNFIFYRKLQNAGGTDSLVNVDGNDLAAFKFDQRQATLSGIEISLDIHPHPLDWLHIQNSFSLVNGRLKEKIEQTNFLPFIPAPRLITEFRGDFKKLGNSLRNVYAKFEIDNTFAQDNVFTAYNTETATPGYSLLNVGLGADIVSSKGKSIFSIYFSGTNITDVAYQNHLNRLKYAATNVATGRQGVFNMGRNFNIKINIPLNFSIASKSN